MIDELVFLFSQSINGDELVCFVKLVFLFSQSIDGELVIIGELSCFPGDGRE